MEPLIAVESTKCSHIGYDGEHARLIVRFHNGRQYVYENVPAKLWTIIDGIRKTPAISLGSALHYLIQKFPDAYPYHELKGKARYKFELQGGVGAKSQEGMG